MTPSAGDPQLYEIRLQGHLDARWADRLEGLTFTLESDGITSLTGVLVDQSALHGLLTQVRDLGMPIVSIRRLCPATQPHQEEGQP
jgi:hypothetical protein